MTFTEQLNALATFSSTDPETQGVTRLPFTPQQQDAAQWLKRQMEDAGLTARVDAYGTVAGVLPGKSEETLIIGSHYDSVPNGGRYDGCSGVIAGIRVAQALREEGVVPAYTLMILGLNDEEGVVLTEGFLSSRGVCGEIDEAAVAALREKFNAALGNDLNTSLAITALYDVLKYKTNDATKLFVLDDFDKVLSLDLCSKAAEIRKRNAAEKLAAGAYSIFCEDGSDDPAVTAQIQARYDAKKAKNFAEADRIRDELKAQGIEITDIPGGAKWKHI